MKVVKFMLKVVLGIVAVVLIAVMTLPLWLGPFVKPTANSAVPKFTKTAFNLGHLYLNPYTGCFEIGELELGNPEKHLEKAKDAVRLDRLVFDVGMLSLFTDCIHIEDVTIDGFYISFVNADGVSNIDQIRYNINGGKEKFEAKEAKAKAKREMQLKEAQAKGKSAAEKKPAEEKSAEEESEKKLMIDKLVINNIKIQYGPMVIPVPSITLTNLGKSSGGISVVELGDELLQAILKNASAVGDAAKNLGKTLGASASMLGESASQSAKDATKAVSDVTSKAASSVSGSAANATKAAGEATKAVGEAAGKATEAAGKALDSLKKLW